MSTPTPQIFVTFPGDFALGGSEDPPSVWATPEAFVTGTDPTLARVFCAPQLVTALLSDPDILVRSRRLSDLINIDRYDLLPPGFVGNPYVPPYQFGARTGGRGHYYINIRVAGSKWRGTVYASEWGPVGDVELLLGLPVEQSAAPPSTLASAGTLSVTRVGL